MAATTPEPGRITIENVNHPGQTQTVDAAKYEAMRAALLAVQLDLEAKGVIAREPVKPLRWHRVT